MRRAFYLILFSLPLILAAGISPSCSKQAAKDLSNIDTNFIAFDTPPVQVKAVQPEYPIDAMIAGIKGVVWVRVLIDTTGNVRDAVVIRDSGKNAGFEEASLNAAKKTKWKPAMADGKPIEVWVTYKVEYNLK